MLQQLSCVSVCLFEHAILAVCAIKIIVKDVSQEPVECRLGSIVNLPCMMHIALCMCTTVVIVFILLSICDCNLNFTVYIYILHIRPIQCVCVHGHQYTVQCIKIIHSSSSEV